MFKIYVKFEVRPIKVVKTTYDVVAGETEVGESRGKTDATVTCLLPSILNFTIHNGGSAAEDNGGSLEEANRRKRDVICRALDCSFHLFLLELVKTIYIKLD